MQNLIKTVTFSVALALVSGCSYVGVYKRDLVQGNLITQDMVSQLETGMTKEQVRYVMGSPLLKGPFNEDRWDYVFYLDEAYDDVEEKRVTLTFQNDRLTDIEREGDLEDDVALSNQGGPGPAVEGSGAGSSTAAAGPGYGPVE
ncbi:Beta-barrel assembly machine subunit BamE [Chromohalobacter marismortui]|uniref:Outer membrane protein assembly factor BamE n=1 Tax=Chromohalobacter marismortui TaxID=42055 RepID=A0A4R7NF87_9GAMM|nr:MULTISPECIES: outer membrane protein assembly factor BamE [Chromohalobacter]MCI0510054.1 outer membrane protein assembly factor BamE [Chromohalobacter sp.]MCI0593787.1 outer membrane protein assembly factor BamE [Chromohalobacter sp.]TDU18977.1 Beta-barrel assembly machine subunit BamE [Chromohalobacter marismortui]